MNVPFVIALAMLALVALVVWAVRSLGKELSGLGDENGDQDRTAGTEEKTPAQQLNDRKLLRQIERWRAGK